jgi:hypothetical protein
MIKKTIGIIILGIVAFVAGLWIGVRYLGSTQTQLAGSSPTGSTYQGATLPAITMNLSVPTGTTTSISNNSGNDQYVTSVDVGCEKVGSSNTAYTGTGLANLQLTIGTSSAPVTANFVPSIAVASNFNISTSTPNFVLASSSPSIATSSNGLIWNAGSVLVISFNATNTAQCTVGVGTIGS